MTAVVLRPLGDARYAVVRGGVDTGVLVVSRYNGWVVRHPRRSGAVVWRRMSQAREWLDSPDGGRWLDELAAEVPR